MFFFSSPSFSWFFLPDVPFVFQINILPEIFPAGVTDTFQCQLSWWPFRNTLFLSLKMSLLSPGHSLHLGLFECPDLLVPAHPLQAVLALWSFHNGVLFCLLLKLALCLPVHLSDDAEPSFLAVLLLFFHVVLLLIFRVGP